ncbi:hypothetical protein [Streptomyces sp. H036]|uniref:hypothetical protein n=1 Tax=Streptomyces sp. H036 TaxID=1519487 RepID=UPI00131EC14D|nr:hypothetical protein [Streptomyces sp. H036]
MAAPLRLPFADDEFDAVAGNFVLNRVGRPLDAIWVVPAAPGQAPLGGPSRWQGSRVRLTCRHWLPWTVSPAPDKVSPHCSVRRV